VQVGRRLAGRGYAHALEAFTTAFPEYASNELYLTGESYFGQYGLNIANWILTHNGTASRRGAQVRLAPSVARPLHLARAPPLTRRRLPSPGSGSPLGLLFDHGCDTPDVVAKYNGTGMAIIGWEIDQVRRTPEGDVSVPIHATYNHHYVSQLIGAGKKFTKVKLTGPDDPRAARVQGASHGRVSWEQEQYIVEDDHDARQPSLKGSSHVQFSSGNGGEYRKTFHGFAPGHAVVVDSPSAFQITPMQIDTWNRGKMDVSGPLPPKFVPGPLPRSSQAPADATYSGLLECPLTTRIAKLVDGKYTVQSGASTCAQPVLTRQECWHAAATTLGGDGRRLYNASGAEATKPPGCSASVDDAASPLALRVFFNTHATAASSSSSSSPPSSSSSSAAAAPAAAVACAAGATAVAGAAAVSLVDGDYAAHVQLSVHLDAANDVATVTLRGPGGVWFGAGLGATAMADAPWALIVDGAGGVSERKLADQQAGAPLAPSVSLVSSALEDGTRTVVVTRPLQGGSADYYSFDAKLKAADASLGFIAAVGSGARLAYHRAKAPASLALLPVGAAAAGACVCPQAPKPFGQASGHLQYNAVANQSADVGSGTVGFGANKCLPWPASDVLNQSNPTCDIRHYAGGQWACHHM